MSIKASKLSVIYNKKTLLELHSLKDINIEIPKGKVIGLAGRTGSGKSTLLQTINGLVRPDFGEIMVDDLSVRDQANLLIIRQKVGLVFQYPEHQFFEENVYDEIVFGLRNFGHSETEIAKRFAKIIDLFKYDFSKIQSKSPFHLSGGQKRLVGLASIIILEPDYLLLDEPFVGLDLSARNSLYHIILSLKAKGKTVFFTSHDVEDLVSLSDMVAVLKDGLLKAFGKTRDIFTDARLLFECGLELPEMQRIVLGLKARNIDIRNDILTVDEAKNEIVAFLKVNSLC